MADPPLTSSLAALTRFFVGARVQDEGRQRTAIFTDEAAPEIDQAQYDSGEGPCIEAFETQRLTRIDSTLRDGAWPAFRRAAADYGIRSTLSLPLVVDKAAVGALNLYARTEGAFSDDDVDTASLFASQAAIVLANAHAYWDARELSSGLAEAMKYRAVVEQAKGMLMAAHGCDEDAAFDLLVNAAVNRGTEPNEDERGPSRER